MLDRQALLSKLFGSAIITTVGYHATSAAVARVTLEEARFRQSRNPYDWLGDGAYFWEAAPERAWEWAHRPRVQTRLGPGVAVGAVRASFREPFDEPIFGGSALYRGAHVQIAVRDESLIEEAWLERGSV
jgi:hypothetical protein